MVRIFSRALLISLLCISIVRSSVVLAEDNLNAASSPKKGWGEFEVVEEEEPSPARKLLLWLPNRLFDFLDIFRADIGVGFSYGAVGRATSSGQFGYRKMDPVSYRFGWFGREAPFIEERSSEYGFGPWYTESEERQVCKGEFGAGIDLIIPGIYLGICTEEILDFFTGIVLVDPAKDDFR